MGKLMPPKKYKLLRLGGRMSATQEQICIYNAIHYFTKGQTQKCLLKVLLYLCY